MIDVSVSKVIDDVSVPNVTLGNLSVHAIIGTYFDDLEFDVGKTVPWTARFVNSTFITDTAVSTGPRYWVVEWSAQLPEAKHTVLLQPYFNDAAAYRQAQFAAADAAWNYADDDWVLFVDASEGLSINDANPPTNISVSPFHSYVYRAVANGVGTSISLPYFVYVCEKDINRVAYASMTQDAIDAFNADNGNRDINGNIIPTPDIGRVQIDVAVPYYIPTGMVRLVKVSALRSPGFDWSQLDTFTEPQETVADLQIVSYAYADWTPLAYDFVNEGIAAGENVGALLRTKIADVRMPDGLSLASPWGDPAQTSALGAVQGPYVDIDIDNNLIMVAGETPEVDAVRTPTYPTIFRKNLRDGVYYLNEELGNLPVIWNGGGWIAAVDPYVWDGVKFNHTIAVTG